MDYYLNQENAFQRIWKEYSNYEQLIIAYDFDNTIYDCHQKGWTFEQMETLIRDLKSIGCYLIIFTANQDLDFVKTYCEEKNIPFDAINENAPFTRSNARKIYYNALLDDRAGLKTTYDILVSLTEFVLKEERQK
ncbi:MAG: hypothetical protein AAFP82_17110 [Bacteroidota bacterium]